MALNIIRTGKQRKRLISLLEELFQLDQPDLWQDDEDWKVRLIEEAFRQQVWDIEQ